MTAVSSSRQQKRMSEKETQKKILRQSEHRLEKNFQTQSVSEKNKFMKNKEQR